ncbi:MAG: radical SAM protein [Candidatus Gorgyraea atricola]|nr:radical SAM protein [Candidatus Gorgyraea atricola]
MLNNTYLEIKTTNKLPRLPLEGRVDLTYRCNNNCRHCWLRISPQSQERKDELSFEEIKRIVSEAKAMGCRRWFISGGEPMLRPDFSEIFDYLTRNGLSYSLNTNGTLITPKIAELMKRKGSKMVALYGASAKVHDHITRNPGSFEKTMRGFRYLKEAGASFIVQLIPMKDNYYEFKDMIRLSESLSKHYRVGAPWLYLSAYADKERNAEIMRQRLAPEEVVKLDKPDLSYKEWVKEENSNCCQVENNGHLFSSCINARRDFHIDPYGKMTFCCFIKDDEMRYDLRKGSFKDSWDNFIPSLATKIKITEEYKENCGACDLKEDCRICPVYGYLEHRDFNKKVEYLCTVARENHKFKEDWQKNHRRYFKIADMTVQVESDLPINEQTFHSKFKKFEVDGHREDTIYIRHHFSLPDLNGRNFGEEVYCRSPWAIYKNNGSWIYSGVIYPDGNRKSPHCVATFNSGHTRARIYNDKKEMFLRGNLHSLTMFPTDQILFARILADREGCYLHSCGVNFEGKGLLFAGHSEAGKSTMATMLKGKAEILCDDRMIVRRKAGKFRIYGTWSHGDIPDISSNSAALKAIFFLEKSLENKILRIEDKKEIVRKLLSCLIRPFVTVDWWEKTLLVIDNLAARVPVYVLRFDKSGEIVDALRQM